MDQAKKSNATATEELQVNKTLEKERDENIRLQQQILAMQTKFSEANNAIDGYRTAEKQHKVGLSV